jgi:hypothetical protein
MGIPRESTGSARSPIEDQTCDWASRGVEALRRPRWASIGDWGRLTADCGRLVVVVLGERARWREWLEAVLDVMPC